MKIISLTLLLALLAIGTYAQTSVDSSDAHKVMVLKKQWGFQVRNPALDENPFLVSENIFQREQDLRDTAAENQRRAKSGFRPVKPPVRQPVQRNYQPSSAEYIYEVKIKNTGQKAISTLTLEYLFFDPNTKKEIGRRQFLSKNNIAPGKTRNLVFRSASPPTGTINAKNASKKSREQYFEQVIIQSVEYADGSSWQSSLKNQ